jgi:tetratricopeptide (TPR) repeat protein
MTRIRSVNSALVCLLLLFSCHVWAQSYVDVDQDFPEFRHYDKILATDTNNASAYRERGTAYYHQENFDKAIADFTQAIALNSKDTAAYTGRGVSHFKNGDLDDALADLKQAVHLKPNSADIYHHLVDVYEARHDWDGVIANATQVIRLNPSESAWACDMRGDACTYKDDLERAMKEYDAAIRLNPTWDAPHYGRGWVFYKKNDLDGALADFDEAVRLNPKNEKNYNIRANIYRKKHDWDALIANWNEAIANNPTNTFCLNARGLDYQTFIKDFEKAIADFTKLIQINPTNSDCHCIRAWAYYENGQYKEARDDFNQAIQLNPKEWYFYSGLAYFLATCPDASFRNGEEALKMARKGCDLTQQPTEWGLDCRDALAAAYAETGDFDEAIRYQKQSLDKVLNARGWGLLEEDKKKMKDRLALFEQHKPYREPTKSQRKP